MPLDHRVADALLDAGPAVRQIGAVAAFGLLLDDDADRVAVHRLTSHACDAFTIAREALPFPLTYRAASATRLAVPSPTFDPAIPVHALISGTPAPPQVIVAPLPGGAGLFWIAPDAGEPPSDGQLRAWQATGDDIPRIIDGPERPDDARAAGAPRWPPASARAFASAARPDRGRWNRSPMTRRWPMRAATSSRRTASASRGARPRTSTDCSRRFASPSARRETCWGC